MENVVSLLGEFGIWLMAICVTLWVAGLMKEETERKAGRWVAGCGFCLLCIDILITMMVLDESEMSFSFVLVGIGAVTLVTAVSCFVGACIGWIIRIIRSF